ncbi:MAG TPA: hypothetical protein VNR65_00570 [Geobacterales bacterium]|nr:hypothetical protein [Geobacterales bacterium]
MSNSDVTAVIAMDGVDAECHAIALPSRPGQAAPISSQEPFAPPAFLTMAA